MPYQPKILAFAGSLRKDSYNKKLVKIAVEGAREAGAHVTLIDLKDYPLPVYDQDDEDAKGLPENAVKLKNLFRQHDALLISAPEYNSSLSAALKNTIDWVSRAETSDEPSLECFQGKVAAIMSASIGGLGGVRGLLHLRSILGNIKVVVLPDQQTLPTAGKFFDAEGNLTDETKARAVKDLGATLANFLTKYHK